MRYFPLLFLDVDHSHDVSGEEVEEELESDLVSGVSEHNQSPQSACDEGMVPLGFLATQLLQEHDGFVDGYEETQLSSMLHREEENSPDFLEEVSFGEENGHDDGVHEPHLEPIGEAVSHRLHDLKEFISEVDSFIKLSHFAVLLGNQNQ